MTSILVTGANGFVGRALCDEAMSQGFHVRGGTRTACHLAGGAENAVVGICDDKTDWMAALDGIDVVIHLAARVHVMKDEAANPLAEFLRVNMQGTANLAYQAAAVLEYFRQSGYRMLPVSPEHVAAVEALPAHHHDPFDRLLVAQSLAEPLHLLTHDTTVARYSDAVILI